MIWKSSGFKFVPFKSNLTHFGAKADIHDIIISSPVWLNSLMVELLVKFIRFDENPNFGRISVKFAYFGFILRQSATPVACTSDTTGRDNPTATASSLPNRLFLGYICSYTKLSKLLYKINI